MVGHWIWAENLEPFVRLVSILCGYDFDDRDWAAISYGIRETDHDSRIWFDYVLEGNVTVFVSVAVDVGTSVTFVNVEANPDLEEKAEVLMIAASEYVLTKH